MIWLYPGAAIALAALAAPLVIHILVRQRATRILFPTLRFIQPHRLASVRRRALEDGALLAVRAAILIVAVGASAGPFLMTAARRRAWDARTTQADVSDPDLHQGIVRAVAWLNHQPAGRRELVVRGALPIGSITARDIAAIPPNVGVRFERTAALPVSRTLPATPVVESGRVIGRETTLNADRTSVRVVGVTGNSAPAVEIVAPPNQQLAAEWLRSVLARERSPEPLPNHTARVQFGSGATTAPTIAAAWIADAAGRVARESDVRVNLQFGSEGNRFLVFTRLEATDRSALDLVRAVARSIAPAAERPADEVVAIPEAQLRAWTREPGGAMPPTRDMIDRDDRRWPWAVVLLLIGLESWMRREPRGTVDAVKDALRAA